MVLVRGASLHDAPGGGDHGAFCQFAGLGVVGASFDGEGAVRCIAPASRRAFNCAVTLLKAGLVVFSAPFSFFSIPVVTSILPAFGSRNGSTRIVFSGVHLYGAAFCFFRPLRHPIGAVIIVPVSSTMPLSCGAPRSHSAGIFTVELGYSAGHTSDSGMLFEILPSINVHAVTPTAGPNLGGTRVWLLGSGYSLRTARLSLLSCRFNDSVTSALIVSTAKIICVTIASSAGIVTVEASNDGQTFTSSGMLYRFQSVRLTALSPTSGPSLGGAFISAVHIKAQSYVCVRI